MYEQENIGRPLIHKTILTFMVLILTLLVAGCNSNNTGLSGKYVCDGNDYSIEFTSSTECTFYADGKFYEGTYEREEFAERDDIQYYDIKISTGSNTGIMFRGYLLKDKDIADLAIYNKNTQKLYNFIKE